MKRGVAVLGGVLLTMSAASCSADSTDAQANGKPTPSVGSSSGSPDGGLDAYCEALMSHADATVEVFENTPEGEPIDGSLLDLVDVEYLPRVVETSPEEFKEAWAQYLEIKQIYVSVEDHLEPGEEVIEATERKAGVLERLATAGDMCED